LLSYHPTFFEEQVKEKQWVETMFEEIESIEGNKTYDLIDLPTNKSNIVVKWVYKIKVNEKGNIEKHKSRLVPKPLSQ
jgi:hypothetical protein